ncbi:histidine phosphatase family protein [Alsobacter soli]|uniref:histidine phosphatase family protein n=1 Tax=Alsobacter soli TaxID=2109933 RepID=UPI001304FB60|nr:histidine phosphatase family protein [Alsobacter soli]
MTTTLFLVRHGAHDQVSRALSARTPGVHLSNEGRRQAEWAAERLARENVAAVHASPMERAQETAQPIARRLGVPVTSDESLNEFDAGRWAGRSFDDLASDPAWTHWNQNRSLARAPDGENAIEVQARVVRCALDLVAKHPGAGVVLVAHAEPLRSLVLYGLGLGPDAWSRIEIAPGSVTTLLIGDWGCRLHRLNEEAPA